MKRALVKIKKIYEFEGILEGKNDEIIQQKAEDIPFENFEKKSVTITLIDDEKKISKFEKREKIMKNAQELLKRI